MSKKWLVQLKGKEGLRPDALDAEIRSVFDEDHLLTPDDVRGEHATLREVVVSGGWPTLDQARGRVYFALDNGGSYRDDYLADHAGLAGRVMFTDSPSSADEAAFIKRNDANASDITSLVQQGFLVRTRSDAETQQAQSNDTTLRELAFASGAQFVSTDYPNPDLDLSEYVVEFEDGALFRCNPINSREGCSFVPEPSLALLQGISLLSLACLGRARRRTWH